MENFIQAILVVIIIACITLGAKSCDHDEAILKRDSQSKCFEQTQDKQCWGIK